MGARAMMERVRVATGSTRPQMIVYGFRNPTIDYYSESAPQMIWSVSDLRGLWPRLEPDHAILILKKTWLWIEREYPLLAKSLVPLVPEGDGDANERSASVWNRWPGRPTMLLRMIHPPGEDEWRDAATISPEPSE